MTTTKVYRNGAVRLAEHSEEVQQAWILFDALKPVERSGRLDSIYASPSIAGMVRWVRGKHLVDGRNLDVDLTNHEITVDDPDNIFMYHVNAYDKASARKRTEDIKAYWNSGIRLSDWKKESAKRGLDASEWEVLLPVNSVKKTTNITDKRLLSHVEDDFDRQQLLLTLSTRRRIASFA